MRGIYYFCQEGIAKILPVVFFGGLTVMPLVIWPWAPIPYEIPRVFFVKRWVEVLWFLGIFAIPFILRRKNIDTYLLFLTLGFVGTAIFSSLLGVDLVKSLWGNYYRHDGLITFFHLVGLFFFTGLFWNNSWQKQTAQSISLGAFLTSILVLVMGFRLWVLGDKTIPHWENGAVGASFGNPNFLAGFLVVTLPFIAYMISQSQNKTERFFWIFALLLQFFSIIATNSWGGVIGLALFTFSWWTIQKQKGWPLFIPVILAGILVLLGVLYFWQYRNLGFVAESRERIIRKILLGVSRRPILGFGWANVDYAFEATDWPIKLQQDVYVDKAHSLFLEVLATTGIVGFMVYVMILGRVGVLLFHQIKEGDGDRLWYKMLFIVFLLYVYHSQTNIISIGEEVVFWLTMGMIGETPKNTIVRNG